MADFQARVTAVLDTSQLKTDLGNIKEKVNVTVNTSNIVSQIQNALKSANFNINITPNTGGGKGSSAKNMVSEYKELYSLAQKMGRLDLRISGLDSNSSLNQIKELERQLTSLSQKFNTTFSQAGSKLSGDQKNNLQAVFADSLNKLKELEANLDRMERSGVPESDIKSQQEKIAMLPPTKAIPQRKPRRPSRS